MICSYRLDARLAILFCPQTLDQSDRIMTEHHLISDRLRARANQLGLAPAQIAEMAGVNRSFVYDILRGRSARPKLATLRKVAEALQVDVAWLMHGQGEVEGITPYAINPDESFVAIAQATPRPSMGGGAVVEDGYEQPSRSYHFRRSWIKRQLRASPSQLRIMRLEGDSMLPTLHDGDTVLVDMTRTVPAPTGIFVLHDGMGLVAKRLELVADSTPPKIRILSDNPLYSPYEQMIEDIRIIGRIRWFAREI